MRRQPYAHHRTIVEGSRPPLDCDQRTWLTQVRGYVDHLFAVVGPIRQLARAARTGGGLELCDVPIRALLADVQALVEPFATREDVSLVVDCARAPAVVRGDRAALSWVLMNLAGGAVRFAPRGGYVSLCALAVPNAVELRVASSRPGVLCSQLDDIFASVVQTDAGNDAERRAAWLGLLMARDLTRLMGGELRVRCNAGTGSHIAVRFRPSWRPARQGSVAAAAQAA
jgi:signal transduction histidine kinase